MLAKNQWFPQLTKHLDICVCKYTANQYRPPPSHPLPSISIQIIGNVTNLALVETRLMGEIQPATLIPSVRQLLLVLGVTFDAFEMQENIS